VRPKHMALLSLLLSSLMALASSGARPNVVLILVDDLAWADIGCYGSKVYETPNVDRLAAQGMRFTDFYSGGPVCSPTRASIMTGKSPVRTGITTYLLHPASDAKRGMKDHLSTDEFTIGQAFKQQGYATGYFGKWHLGYEAPHWAREQGFDTAIGGMDLPWAWELAHPGTPVPMLDRRKGHTRFFSPHHLTWMENGPEGEYLTDRLTDETMRFIKAHKQEPFFALLSFHTVHTPLQVKPEVEEYYRRKIETMGLAGKKEPNKRFKRYQNLPEYAAMVHHMDENVGRLMQCLKSEGLEDDTVLVFTSDNGGKGSVTSNLPLNGAKHDLREGGIRVPTIVRWPGRVNAGSTSDCPLITHDLYPTFCELLGFPLRPEQHKDGVSFKDVLFGARTEVERDALYWHYPHNRQEGAVRMGDYKLIQFYKTGKVELFNLKEDIGELNDISATNPELTKQMKNMLKRWLLETGAKGIGVLAQTKGE